MLFAAWRYDGPVVTRMFTTVKTQSQQLINSQTIVHGKLYVPAGVSTDQVMEKLAQDVFVAHNELLGVVTVSHIGHDT